MSNHKRVVEDLLGKADIRINGDRPWDIHIQDDRTFTRSFAEGSLGFGERKSCMS